MKTTLAFAAATLAAMTAACTGTTYTPPKLERVGIPVKDTTPQPKAPPREGPPGSGPARELTLPAPTWAELEGGLRVGTIESHALPIVQLRAVIFAGKAADGERPGLATLTAELLKDGGAGPYPSRELLTRIESLGASLSVDTYFDKTVLGLAVTKDRMGEALELLASMVMKPRLDPAEFGKLKKRELERVADAARTSGRWAATMVLWRDLFDMPSERHPYATFDATPAEVEKISRDDVRAFHQKWFVPKNVMVVVAGDTTPAVAKEQVGHAFMGFRGADAPRISFTDPMPPKELKITLVHRPKAKQSDVFVGVLGPTRAGDSWPEATVANQVLGGGPASRLFLDVREKQSLAYNTRSSLSEVAHGPVPLVAYVGTQTAKTGLALKGVLDHLSRLATTEPSAEELDGAKRYLGDVLAIRLETIGAVADEVVQQKTLGLPDDYLASYRKELREVSGLAATKAAADAVRDGQAVVVVAGDADRVGGMLSHFGEVKVVDPTKGFERIRSLAKNPAAPLELPREAGE